MQKKSLLIAVIIAVILIISTRLSTTVEIILKFFVNNFATGRSDFKIIAFLVYLILCSFIIFFCYQGRFDKIKSFVTKKRIALTFVVLLMLTFIIGLTSYIYFINNYNLDYFAYHRSVYDGKQSSTSLYHIHTLKGGMAKIVNYIDPNLHHNYDSGLFYSEHLPAFFWIWSFMAIPLLFIFALLTQFFIFQKFFWNKYSNFYFLIYIISSFSVIKTSIDGGIVSSETMFWFTILLSLFSNFDNIKTYFKNAAIFVLAGFFFVSFPYMVFYDGITYLLLNYLAYIIFFMVLFAIFFFVNIMKSIKLTMLIITLIILLYFISIFLLNFLYPHTYLNFSVRLANGVSLPVPSNFTVNVYYPHFNGISPDCDSILYTQSDFSICQFNTTEDTTLLKLLEKYSKIPPNYKPLMIEYLTCNASHTKNYNLSIVIIDNNIPAEIITNMLNISFHKINETENYQVCIAEVNASSCIPAKNEVFQRIMNKGGVKSYIIKYPITNSTIDMEDLNKQNKTIVSGFD
ncbi:MAG: hypothetical protein ABIG89_01185 [Candidatus Woesearchaeota archaeon]